MSYKVCAIDSDVFSEHTGIDTIEEAREIMKSMAIHLADEASKYRYDDDGEYEDEDEREMENDYGWIDMYFDGNGCEIRLEWFHGEYGMSVKIIEE